MYTARCQATEQGSTPPFEGRAKLFWRLETIRDELRLHILLLSLFFHASLGLPLTLNDCLKAERQTDSGNYFSVSKDPELEASSLSSQ